MKPNAGLERRCRPLLVLQVLLCLTGVALTSCIITYRDFPQVDGSAPLSKKNVPIYYDVDPLDLHAKALLNAGAGYDFPYPSRENYEELRRAFTDTHVFSEAIPTSSPPAKGIFCSVEVIHTPQSTLAGGFALASITLLTLTPAYSASSVDTLQFELYVDKELKKTYRYRVTKVKGTWIILLPFAWINFFTPSRTEAFRAAADQFFLDADRDGYFKSS